MFKKPQHALELQKGREMFLTGFKMEHGEIINTDTELVIFKKRKQVS